MPRLTACTQGKVGIDYLPVTSLTPGLRKSQIPLLSWGHRYKSNLHGQQMAQIPKGKLINSSSPVLKVPNLEKYKGYDNDPNSSRRANIPQN